MQLVVMNIKDNIHKESHLPEQFIRIESGNAKIEIFGEYDITTYKLKDGDGCIIPSGVYHKITNISNAGASLKLYTVYSKPQHNKNLLQMYNVED